MKNFPILALVVVILAFNASAILGQDVPLGRERLKVQECTKLNKTIKDPSNTALSAWVKSIEGSGFIKFDLEKMQNNTDLQLIRPLLGMSAPNSFVTIDEAVSPANPDVTFVTAQQYYNGILVEGGGYEQGFINCVTFFLNAYIFEEINIGLTPTKTKQQAIAAVQSHESGTIASISENQVQLVIDQDLTESCNYILAWKLSYTKGSMPKVAFVDASNGTVYKETYQKREINAPTADFGTVTLDDYLNFDGTLRYLKTPDFSVITFDKSEVNEAGFFSQGNHPYGPSLEESIPASLSEWPTGGANDPEPEVYQAHYVTSNARSVLESFGLAFPSTVYVAGHVNFEGAGYHVHTDADNVVQEVIYFGWFNPPGSSTKKSPALFDAAGHELTHMHLSGKFGSGGEPGGIEEAICDIFGEYTERNCPNGLVDWIAGGQNGLNVRDMVNPEILNYFPAIGDEDDVHDIAGPMGRWFTILVDGGTFSFAGTNHVVPGMDISDAAFLVLTSINFMNSGSDYLDARAATIAAAELIYGDCSDEVEAVATAWYAVGVGYPEYCKLVVAGALAYCEENLGTAGGNVDLTLLNPIPNYTYKWIYPYDWHAIGESTPQTYFGLHLRMYEYSYMPNFPRYYSITLKEYDQSNTFLKYRHITIKIKDCDGDDPQHPCGDDPPSFMVVGQNGQEEASIQQSLSPANKITSPAGGNAFLPNTYDADLEYEFSIYDISGREVQSGKLDGNPHLLDLPSSGMYIVYVYDSHRKSVQVGKIFFVKD